MFSSDKQWAAFLTSKMLSEFVSRSQSFTTNDYEYLSFSIKGIIFYKKTLKVFSLLL